MNRYWIAFTMLLLIFTSFSNPAFSKQEKQSYAKLQGQVLNEWRKPVGGVSVTLNSQTNGYATNNLVATSDLNGNYIISNIPKFIYSSGPEPKVVEYYLTVNYPGYDLYSSDTFTLDSSSSTRKDIRLKSSVVK